MTKDAPGGHLVVIGSSAGGIEALSILVGTLPRDFPAPIVLAQHLDPKRPSHLSEILARRTDLPVVTVEDRADLVDGTIHVVPSNRHLTVTDHSLGLAAPVDDARPVPSVDHVFATAAEAFGERLIAVILTGTGSDGAEGARRVKVAGGTVVIQDPETARFPSMPGSLAPTSVDIVAPIEAIGPLLHDLVTGLGKPPQPDEERLLATFLDHVRDRTGIDFSTYKRPTILRRLQRRMAATRSETLHDYVRLAGRQPDEVQRLASSFLIKVTEFFRDQEMFDHLRDVILPQAIATARDGERELRIWSAGCATGEEAYSLSMLVADLLGDELPDWTVRVFATDLDADAIAFARRGIYPSSALQHVPHDLLNRHFSKLDGTYEVRKSIRAMTVFGQHDLALRAPFPRIDVALCRNVLIYFTGDLQRRALHLFAFSLRDGGWLVLGKAETTSPLPEYFAVADPHLKVFRRRGQRAVVPAIPARYSAATALRHLSRAGGDAPDGPPAAATAGPGDRHPAAEQADVALTALPVGVVVVDRSYDLVSINPAARRLLSIHGTAVNQDFVHLADRLPSAQLRAAIDEALAGRPASLTADVSSVTDPLDKHLSVEILCQPGLDDQADGRSGTAVIVVRDVTAERGDQARLDAAAQRGREETDRAAHQVDSLREANQGLLRDNEDLAKANVELRGANEELVVANEEVQAATEEVETLNEELQATVEELETLNEELQATVEELNTTNDDLEARTLEVLEIAARVEAQRRTAETERARLATLIEAMRDAVLVVDRSGETVVGNRAFEALFESGTLRSEEERNQPLDAARLRARVAAGEEFVLPFSIEPETGPRRWYEAYSRPVPVEMGIGEGGILVVHDTTDISLRRLQEEFIGIMAHELRTPLTALIGYLQMLQRRNVDTGERPVLPLAVEQADRLQRLVDELFDVTRVERGGLSIRPEAVDLGDLVDQTVEIASGLSARHRIRVERPDVDVVAAIDRARVQQVLLNLLMNAIIHAPDSPDIDVRFRKLRRRAEIEVEDRGPGIPRDQQEQLFTRFAQGPVGAGRSGLGLGLYIAHEIVVAHGGTIEVDSEPGEGTTFTMRLPLQPVAVKGGRGAAARAATNGRRPPPRDKVRL